MPRIKTPALILAALAILAAAAPNASARALSISEREFEVLFSPLTLEFAGNTMRCPLTLLGHFERSSIAKQTLTRVGVINHVTPTTSGEPPCTGGTLTILTETLPWEVKYVGFTGTLPNITRIRLSVIRIAYQVRTSGGITCLAGTTATEPLFGELSIGAGGRVEGLRVDETRSIRLGGGFICGLAGSSRFIGTGTVLNLAENAAITVTLI